MDPISPELVLVDPELALRARAELPDRRDLNGGTGRRTVAEEPPARALRLRFLLAAGGASLVLLAVLIRPFSSGDPAAETEREISRAPRPAAALPRPRAVRESPLPSPRRASQILEKGWAGRAKGNLSVRPAEEPRPHTPRRSRKAPSGQQGPRAPAHPRIRVPTRLFVWLPTRGADYYNVRFFEGARTVFEAWPTDPRVTVPMRGIFRGRRFAFTNGRYRWIVRPAFGSRSRPRYGEPIVRSLWVVP